MPTTVLYLTSSKPSLGCKVAEEMVTEAGNPETVLVQDVDSLQAEGVTLPEWLRGTPTLVDVESREVFAGVHALEQLKALLAPSKRGGSDQTVPVPAAPPESVDEDIDGMIEPSHAGSWSNEDADNAQIPEPFDLQTGCDPENMGQGKVTTREVHSMLQARGIDVPANDMVEGTK